MSVTYESLRHNVDRLVLLIQLGQVRSAGLLVHLGHDQLRVVQLLESFLQISHFLSVPVDTVNITHFVL